MRIGLFGGTFNPVHIGHLRVALEILEGFDLSCCYLIPSAIPPHKQSKGVIDAEHRLEMLRLAAGTTPGFCVSDVELNRRGPSYTIDTVRFFKSMLPPGAALHFIVGVDAFLEIDTWHRYMELFQEISFIVMTRPADAGDVEPAGGNRYLEAFVRETISSDYRAGISPFGEYLFHPTLRPVYRYSVSALAISATHIRHLIKTGKSIRFLVPDKVEAYIKSKGLYT